MTSAGTGAFVVSMDTELAWGTFDTGPLEASRYDGCRRVIRELLNLFDQYRIPATWAIVTHLLTDCREADTGHPTLRKSPRERDTEWYNSLPCRRNVDETLWYEPGLIDWLQDTYVSHDVGSHTHTHFPLDRATQDSARWEIERSLSVIESCGLNPVSFVYPRNRIDHVDILHDAGFEVYRGVDNRPYETWQLPELLRGAARFGEEAAQRTPPTVVPTLKEGLVEIPGSQVFRPYHGGWQYTLRHSQKYRALAGLNRASRTGEIFHLWFHPFNCVRDPEPLLNEFETVLSHAAALREQGELEVHTMSSVATEYLGGRWRNIA